MENRLKKHLSEHFTLYEFTRSGAALDYGLRNQPDATQQEALRQLCLNILEPLRRQFGPVVISSGFRSPEVNRRVGGVPASQHMRGEAADIVFTSLERCRDMYRFIVRNLDYDQLIIEPMGSPYPRWLHVSYTLRHKNRHQRL